MLMELTTGWTKPIILTLKNNPGDGAVVVDISGTTVELVVKLNGQTLVTTTGDLAIHDGPAGQVKWTPDLADLSVGDYTLKVKVTDAQGISYFPNGRPVDVRVSPE